MFPFWKKIIEPALVAAGASRVVEIGAERGWTTVQMLEPLGPEAELHVIDPVPGFDPTEHDRRFPGRYLFHRDLSHNVLPGLPPVDAALDRRRPQLVHGLPRAAHARATAARDAGRPLPVLILHDVCWPYGRRDLYYAPERIPEEFRQPYDTRGMPPGERELADEGGLNPTCTTPSRRAGPATACMTALDDFIAEHDRPLRRVVLPIYFGLAIVVEQERLDARPRSPSCSTGSRARTAARAARAGRVDPRSRRSVLAQRSVRTPERRADRAARRYLDLLKGALLDEHYLENEVRIEYLLRCIEAGEAPSAAS